MLNASNFYKSRRNIPTSLGNRFIVCRNRYNNRALNILTILGCIIFFLLWGRSTFTPVNGKIEFAVNAYSLTYLIIIGLCLTHILFEKLRFPSRYRFAINLAFIYSVSLALVYLTWLDLHFDWDLSAFLITLLLFSTVVWLDNVSYLILCVFMFTGLIVGISTLEFPDINIFTNLVNLAIYLVIGIMVMLSSNEIRINNFISIEKLKNNNRKIKLASFTDPLTGLKNRRFLESIIGTIQSMSDRHKKPFSLVLIDIDHFKSVNDTYGHQAGDQVLAEFSLLLLNTIRLSDFAFRVGGEEFILLLNDIDRESSLKISSRLLSATENYNFKNIDRKITVSMGISDNFENNNLDKLVGIADKRLYQAKLNGRNQIVFN